jgi:hypothetical protein
MMHWRSIAPLIVAGALIIIGLSSVLGPPDEVGGVHIAVGVSLAVVKGFRATCTSGLPDFGRRHPRSSESNCGRF